MEQTMWKTAEGQTVALLSSLLLLLTFSLLSLLLLRRRLKLNLPPTPFLSLPLVGHLPHLLRLRSSYFFHSLRNSLGPIFTLHVGSTPIIFIASAALAREALVQKSLLFSSRPTSSPPSSSLTLFSNNFHSIISASYGPYWRTMRRNLVHELLAMPKILSFKPARALILDHLISLILAEARQNEGIVSVYTNATTAMSKLLLFMCFGFHIPEDDVMHISALIPEILQIVASGNLQDLYPYPLRVFKGTSRQRALHLRAKQVQLFCSLIQKHKELHKLGELAPVSYVETLLHMDSSNPLSVDDLVTLCTELLVGGIDTTVTTLEWTMAHLVEDPSIQNKLYDQISDVVGDRLIEEEDLPHLPYLQAVIRESLRLHPPVHFSPPHAVSELCKVGGYDIPPNAVVQFHTTSISRDPEIWEEPLKFRPERFLTADVDITGTKELTMIPFGAGRRICPGLGLASVHMELFLARLLQAFQWAKYPSGERVDLTEKPFFTVRMKHPLRVLVKGRRTPK